jgi:hypothetical protein
LEAYVTSETVTIDMPMQPDETLPEASNSIAARALEEVKPLEQFKLPVDD